MTENEYSGGEFSRLRQDAVNRAKEMQKRAKNPVGTVFGKPEPSSSLQQEKRRNPGDHPPLGADPGRIQKKAVGNLLWQDGLELDEERILLLLLIVLLLHEGTDRKLILALCYLLI